MCGLSNCDQHSSYLDRKKTPMSLFIGRLSCIICSKTKAKQSKYNKQNTETTQKNKNVMSNTVLVQINQVFEFSVQMLLTITTKGS